MTVFENLKRQIAECNNAIEFVGLLRGLEIVVSHECGEGEPNTIPILDFADYLGQEVLSKEESVE